MQRPALQKSLHMSEGGAMDSDFAPQPLVNQNMDNMLDSFVQFCVLLGYFITVRHLYIQDGSFEEGL